ncbi:MAG: hypothetical protein ILP07_06995 [Treponema sp.]|nr:hypothetical protein [Treponema sp.]
MKIWIILAVAVLLMVIYVLTREKSRFVPADINKVKDSIKELLNADYTKDGFIIIKGNSSDQFIQFERVNFGLLLWWPNVKVQQENIEKLKLELKAAEYFSKTESDQKLENLRYKEFLQNDEGVYVNVGDNSDEIADLVKRLFRGIFGYDDFDNLKIQLDLGIFE